MNKDIIQERKQLWTTISLINLSIVAFLGFVMRSKILFPIRILDFKFLLHAHSHFAFSGWVSLAILSLMIFEILPSQAARKPIYKWLLVGILLNALGMMVSFLIQGYAFFSILFSTLFILVTYVLAAVFIRDLLRGQVEKTVVMLSIGAVICLVTSSVGPFTLAYLLASKSGNYLLYRDSIYTYLHLQYNGFFSLGVFAIFFNKIGPLPSVQQKRSIYRFALMLCISVFPTLFISYLWHYPNIYTRIAAISGCVLIVVTLGYFVAAMRAIGNSVGEVPVFIRNLVKLSFAAFVIKSVLQTGTVIPWLGNLVFADRAIIIGYLHLVLLGFISSYLLAHLFHCGVLHTTSKMSRTATVIFISGIIANETILMVQGFGNMLMIGNHIYSLLLWLAAICLFLGALLIILSKARFSGSLQNVPGGQPNVTLFH